jgi:hypothetical protein
VKVIRCHWDGTWMESYGPCPKCGREIKEPRLMGRPMPPLTDEERLDDRSIFERLEPCVSFVNGYRQTSRNL